MMASLVHGLFGRRGRELPSLQPKLRSNAGRVILRGLSKRAYSFEVLDREVALPELGGVYIYARRIAADAGQAASRDGNGAGLALGYIGRTANIAWQDTEHERLAHFVGHAFDVVLLLPVESEPIRLDMERDLIALHRPVLNDLLCGHQPGDVS